MKNPYQPLNAALELKADGPKRPTSFYVAIVCVAVSFVLAIIDSDAFADFELQSAKTVFYFVVFSLTTTFIYFSWVGHNWARILCLLTYLAPDSFNRGAYAIKHIANSEMPRLFSVLILVLNIVAFFLLFKKETSQWISRQKSYRKNGF